MRHGGFRCIYVANCPSCFARIASASRPEDGNGNGWRKYRESQGQDCWRGNSRRDFAPDAAHFANNAEHSDSGSVRTHWDHARARRESYR